MSPAEATELIQKEQDAIMEANVLISNLMASNIVRQRKILLLTPAALGSGRRPFDVNKD